MTALTTFIIRVVANSIVLEFAGRRIAAVVIDATGGSTTIAIFSCFDNAVTALLTRNRCHALVAAETECLDTVALESCTYIANGARAESGNTLSSGRIHNVFFSSITGTTTERTALLLGGSTIAASLASAIVDGAKGVSCFVSAVRVSCILINVVISLTQ